MLKQELCKRCYEKVYKWNRWNENDEELWKEEYVWCPLDYVGKGERSRRETTEQPPSNCPFILEHTI